MEQLVLGERGGGQLSHLVALPIPSTCPVRVDDAPIAPSNVRRLCEVLSLSLWACSIDFDFGLKTEDTKYLDFSTTQQQKG